ncbi:hypothetical protein B0O99DRAFT_628773 [Bisporella sp. PMI_857]|nr:hypothetical protein B0O99DRAFT_628773 [Bisporella sp. PMI_857]
MFTTLPTPNHKPPTTRFYTPAFSSPLSSSPLKRSPLSPRDHNMDTAADSLLSPMRTPSKTRYSSSISENPHHGKRESVFSKRQTKPNPLLNRNSEEGRETRRKLFLKRVKEESEERRWKKKGGDDEMMRTIFILEERREMERRRREAASLDLAEEGDMDDLDLDVDAELAEEIARREMEELDMLVREREMMVSMGGGDTPYGSDEEEYDDIFMDVIQEEIKSSQQQPATDPMNQAHEQARHEQDHDMMDIS